MGVTGDVRHAALSDPSDADVYGPNTPQMLGITSAPQVGADKRMLPPEAHGLKVISMGMLVPPDQPLIWRGPMLHGAVQQFMRDVAWGFFYGTVNFDNVFGTVNHYGTVEMFIGLFNEAYRSSNHDATAASGS